MAVGLGARPGRSADHILAALRTAIPGARIACLATIDRRAGEPGVRWAAEILGVPLHGFTAAQLADVPVPNSSDRVVAAFGIPGVAEAAALLAGAGSLLVPRRVVSGVVIAAAAHRAEDITGATG
ncbi:cobalamin biosynthesis protein [Nocardia flavorosea]|uniref:Cobalamin biosynthesis protein n=1 Tax=Nocardia flavorosea TaxID=53429 RepID=A0A846YLA9_9NOCA|nr:cobalamin biosynthesis protein [Nocardia flavorosea]